MDTKRLYAILDVKQDASQDQIRRAYKKLALKYHPDKNRGDPDAEQKFKEIQNAHQILSNPDKRQLYDMYGEAGLRFGDELPPELISMGLTVFASGCICVTCMLLLFPVLLALQLDGTIDWLWGVIFVPVWLLDLFLLGASYIVVKSPSQDNQMPTPGAGAMLRYLGAARIWCFAAFTVLLALRLDGAISWSWAAVLSPCVLMELSTILFSIKQTLAIVNDANAGLGMSAIEAANAYFSAVRSSLCRIIFVVFLVMRLNASIDWTWWSILSVLYLPEVLFLAIDIAVACSSIKAELNEDDKEQKTAILYLTAVFSVVYIAVTATFLGLLSVYLTNLDISYDGMSMGLVLLPVFIILGAMLSCGVCLCFSSAIFGAASGGSFDYGDDANGRGSYHDDSDDNDDIEAQYAHKKKDKSRASSPPPSSDPAAPLLPADAGPTDLDDEYDQFAMD